MSAIETARTFTPRQWRLVLALIGLAIVLGFLVGANYLEIKDAVGTYFSGLLTVAAAWRQS